MATNSLDFLLNLQANTTGFDQGVNGAKFAVNALVGAMAALGMGLGVKELAEAADSYAMLSAKIQQSTKDSGNLEVVPLFLENYLCNILALSLCQSRSFSVARLSCNCLPFTSAISSLTR